MRHDSMVLTLISAVVGLVLATSVQAATDATDSASKESTATAETPAAEAGATSEKAETARHRRKVHLNAQRRARQEARKQAAAQNPAVQVASGPVVDLAVSFKVDPRMTRSLYMGDRWFSAPTFTTVQDTNRVNVEVRAVGRDASGRKAQIAPEWVSADPKIVSVSPARGSEVTITVHRAGESSLRLVQPLGQGDKVLVKEFAIRAWNNQGSAIQAEISQKDLAKAAPSRQGGTKQLGMSAPAANVTVVTAARAEGNVPTSAAR